MTTKHLQLKSLVTLKGAKSIRVLVGVGQISDYQTEWKHFLKWSSPNQVDLTHFCACEISYIKTIFKFAYK